MATLTSALRTAQSGLLVNQTALDAVSNNIANVNSKGYSRKVVHLEQRVVNGAGAGVQLGEVQRQVDEGLIKSMRREFSNFNAADVKTSFFDRTQDLFGAPGDNTSLAHIISSFTAALESLAADPSQTLERSEVTRQGREISDAMRSMSTIIQDLRQQADNFISDYVTEINTITTDISTLNDQLVRNSAIRADVSDLRDQRDQKLNRLSELIDIRYFYRDDGDVVVFTSAGRTLVDNIPPTISHSAVATMTASATHANGAISGIYAGESIAANDFTEEIAGGVMKGLIDLRDLILPGFQSQLDELATEMRDTFNQVHNAGVAFPGAQSITGTRSFIDSATSTITFGGTTDTTIVLFNSTGDQQAQTTVRTLIGGATATVNATASAIQTWLQANGAASASAAITDGKLVIDLGTSSRNLAFRDQTATANGSTRSDATIRFNVDASAATGNAGSVAGMEEVVSGFSNFFGLNDFFIDSQVDNILESDIIASTFSTTAATLTFYGATDGIATPLGSVAIASGLNIDQFVTAINNADIGVTAAAVPDADGFRIRITSSDGLGFAATQAAANTLLTTLNLHVADVGVASRLDVRSDVRAQPSRVAAGVVQWDANLGVGGEYYASSGDDTNAIAMANLFTGNNQFDFAGGLTNLNTTFSSYATAIVSFNADLAANNKADSENLKQLADSLQHKSDTFRGVNLDEELSQLIVYEQGYGAAARVVSVIQSMFDVLQQAIG